MMDAQGLSAGYVPGRHVIEGIDLSVRKGEVIGLLGRNGSGKTTLLRCLSGSIRPDKGAVRLNGEDIRRMRARQIARNVAFVPQEQMVAFDFKVEDVVLMGRYPWMGWFGSGGNGHSVAVEDAMRTVGIDHLIGRPVGELSGGERRMVFLARALAQRTPIVLLDEPTKDLDIKNSMMVLGALRRLSKEKGLSVVMVLHDMGSVLRFCDKALLIKDGRTVSQGPTEAVLTPSNVRVAFDVGIEVHRKSGRVSLEVIG